jgi:hypothetical protein
MRRERGRLETEAQRTAGIVPGGAGARGDSVPLPLRRPAPGLAFLVAGTLLHARAGYLHHDLSGHAGGGDDA